MRSEMLENYVALSITNILAMLLLAFVVGRNNLLDRKMKRFFSTAIFCTILVILAEIGTSVFGQPVASFSLPNMFFYVLGFSLSPFITISLAFVFNHKNYRNIFYLFLPAVTNMLLAMLSPKFGLIFSISQQKEYFRGPCCFVYVAAYIWSMTILFKETLYNAKRYQNKDCFALLLLFLFILGGTSIQVLFPSIHTTGSCVSLSLILYYAFFCELKEKHDILTGLFNRRAYEYEIQHLESLGYGAIIFFDVDDFKKINDQFGHQYGDQCLSTIASLILKSFSGIGFCYRIGGDEFGVLSDKADEIDILNAISLFINNLNSSREQDCNLPLVSMGYSIYHKSEGSIEQAISKADAQLYRYKKLHKQETKEPGKTNCNFSCSLTERTPH